MIKTILCVEDDRFIGEMYVRSLQKAGYDVTWVVDGNDGLVAARNQNFDLIILDLMLPEQRGDQILDALRNNNDDMELRRTPTKSTVLPGKHTFSIRGNFARSDA
jgi:DNA-binding response OmpR family regulator